MIANVLMLVGGLLWLTGELLGAFYYKNQKGDTTSEFVWLLQRKWWPVRVLVALFLVWLGVHLWFQILPT